MLKADIETCKEIARAIVKEEIAKALAEKIPAPAAKVEVKAAEPAVAPDVKEAIVDWGGGKAGKKTQK